MTVSSTTIPIWSDIPCLMGAEHEYRSKKKYLRKLAAFFSYAVATGGDMTAALAESLLDDLSTDGHKLHSAKIQDFGSKLLTLLQIHGPDIPIPAITHLNGWQTLNYNRHNISPSIILLTA